MTLTATMRKWLNTREPTMRTWEVTLEFIRVFRLTAHEAGLLLAQWSREVYARLP